MSKLFDAAKQFIKTQQERRQAVVGKEKKLKSKIAELEERKRELQETYDPSKPYDPKPIQKLDSEIESTKQELSAVAVFKSKPKEDFSASIEEIEKIKSELRKSTEKHIQSAEETKKEIEEAKARFLSAQKKYHDIQVSCRQDQEEAGELIKQISTAFRLRISELRREQERLGHELYQASPGMGFDGTLSNQPELDELRDRQDSVRREILKLEGVLNDYGSKGISDLKVFRDGNGKTVYFIHDQEQLDAAEKGIIEE